MFPLAYHFDLLGSESLFILSQGLPPVCTCNPQPRWIPVKRPLGSFDITAI